MYYSPVLAMHSELRLQFEETLCVNVPFLLAEFEPTPDVLEQLQTAEVLNVQSVQEIKVSYEPIHS